MGHLTCTAARRDASSVNAPNETAIDPGPEPEALSMLSQLSEGDAVQVQPAAVEMLTVSEVWCQCSTESTGDTEYSHAGGGGGVAPAPAWRTGTARPATLSAAWRSAVAGFGATRTATVPVPLPDVAEVNVTHGELAVAVHSQPALVATETDACAPAAITSRADGETA